MLPVDRLRVSLRQSATWPDGLEHPRRIVDAIHAAAGITRDELRTLLEELEHRRYYQGVEPHPSVQPADIAHVDDQLRAHGFDPRTWRGRLHVVCPGKAGEVFFVTGVVPALRRRVPNARLVLVTIAKYRDIAAHATHAFDEIEPLPHLGGDDSLACRAMAVLFGKLQPHLAMPPTADEHFVFAYRTLVLHGMSPAWPKGPFYHSQAESVGIAREEYELPTARTPAPAAPDLALAFPVLNEDASRRGHLTMTSLQWAAIAQQLAKKGLACVATGHQRVDLPGWTWRDATLGEVVPLIQRAGFFVGGNSGMTFLAGLLSHGPVAMLDDNPHGKLALYDASTMPLRIHQLPADAGDAVVALAT